MSDEELLALNNEGFIPGPGEKEEEFAKRVEEAKFFFKQGQWIGREAWDWAWATTQQAFGFKSLWVPAFYGKKGLFPWEAGAAWLEGRKLSGVQLREKGWACASEEVLAHEAVHAARSGFEEPRFEEFFAYATAAKKWRRVLGPIVRRPWEVWPFLIGALYPSMAALWAALGLARLIRNHWILRKAASFLGGGRRARILLLRMTDLEIVELSRGRALRGDGTPRWRLIELLKKEIYG